MKNKVVGLPYAPSTICMYYNKDAFKEAGLDPEVAPRTIKELGEYSAKLTKRDGETITQYGFGILWTRGHYPAGSGSRTQTEKVILFLVTTITDIAPA